jgi:hypothetical protein
VNPARHVQPQIAPLQVRVELAGPAGHGLPQPLQLSGSVCTSRHAVGAAAGQPENMASHSKAHAPALQTGLEFGGFAVHGWPQPPQLPGSLCRSKHAVGAALGHPESPGSHAQPHVAALHVPMELDGPGAHTLPQPPQSWGSLIGSTQVAPQRSGVLGAHATHE